MQAAVAKAVADCVEENAFAGMDIEATVILVSAFVHPDAKDYNRIYRYNYGATKLALHRALEKFPDLYIPSYTRKTVQPTASWDSNSAEPGHSAYSPTITYTLQSP